MKVSVEEISNTVKKINLVIPADQIKQALNLKLKQISKTFKLDGFRKGNVPIKLIQQKFGHSIYQEVIDDLINNNLNKVLTDNSIEIVGKPNLDSIEPQPHHASPLDFNQVNDLDCTFSLQIYPEVKFNDFAALNVTVPAVTVSPDDVAAELVELRKKYGTKVVVARSAANGDTVTVDFVARIDNQEFPGGKGDDVKIELGKGSFIDGIESGLLGGKAGDEITLNVTLPEEYSDKSLAGKLAVFNFKIKQVEEQQLAEINSDLAKKLNITIDLAETDLTAPAINDIELKIHEKIAELIKIKVNKLILEVEHDKILTALIENYPVELPSGLVDMELKRLQQYWLNNSKNQGLEIANLSDKVVEKLKIQANKNVHQFILLRSIVKQNELKIDFDAINAELHKFGSYFNQFKHKESAVQFKNYIVNSKYVSVAMDFLAAKVTKIVEPMTVAALMKLASN